MRALILGILFLPLLLAAEEVSFNHFTVKDMQGAQQELGMSAAQAAGNAAAGNTTSLELSQNLLDLNPLYAEILAEMNNSYNDIGTRLSQGVIGYNQSGPIAGLNTIGFTYQQPFFGFSIIAKRNLAPDVFDDKRWIVTDEFRIIVEAHKMFGDLKDKGYIDMTEAQLGGFAGMSFQRVYTYTHFANSYLEGLTGRFDKLFLAFKYMRGRDYLELSPYEIITMEDYLSAKAGLIATYPIYANITASAGVLAKFDKIAKVTLQSVGAEDLLGRPQGNNPERLRISVEKTKSARVGVVASIQADFLNFLRVTLLSYELHYEYGHSYKTYVTLHADDMAAVQNNPEQEAEIGKMLRGSWGNPLIIAPYIESEEERITQTVNSKYLILLMGGNRQSQTEQVQVAKDGVLKMFFRHHYENTNFVQDPLSKLISIVISSILKMDYKPSLLASESKYVHMEYESWRNLVKEEKVYDVSLKQEDYENIMVTLEGEYYARRTTGWLNGKFKERAMEWMATYPVPEVVVNNVKSNYLRGPLRINTKLQLKNAGVIYFHELSLEQIAHVILEICDDYPLRSNLLSGKMSEMVLGPRAQCQWALQKKYVSYRQEVDKQLKKNPGSTVLQIIPLWKFKDLLRNLNIYAKNKAYMDELFGAENVFFYGRLEAKTKAGVPFETYFNQGKFKGPGLAEGFVMAPSDGGINRSPAALTVD
jgi:hypothetical protein